MLKNKILSAYLTSVLGVFSGLLTNFWLLREITGRVSATDFGIYSFTFQIASYLAILQLGLDFSASRSIATFLGKNEPEKAAQTYGGLVRFNKWLGGAGFLGLSGVAAYMFFFRGSGESLLSGKLLMLASIVQLINFAQRPLAASLIGSGRQDAVNIITVIRTLVNSVIAYVFLESGAGIFSVVLAELITVSGATFVLLLLFRRLSWVKKSKHVLPSKEVNREILHFGFWSTVGGLAWTIEGTSDVLFLKGLAGIPLLTIYVIWWRFPQMIFDLCTRLASSAFPFFSRLSSHESLAGQALFKKIFVVVLFFAGISLLGIGSLLNAFIPLWMKGKFLFDDGAIVAVLMGVLVMLRIIGNFFGLYLLSLGNTRITTRVAWTQAIVKVGIAFVALPYFGLPGLIAASISAALIQALFYGFYIKRKHAISFSGIELPLSLTIIFSACAIFFFASDVMSWTELFLKGGVLAILYILVFLFSLSLRSEFRPLLPLLKQALIRDKRSETK